MREIEADRACVIGCSHTCPAGCVPQGRGKYKARRRALGRRDTETGCVGRAAGGEEPQGIEVVPAQGDQLEPSHDKCKGAVQEEDNRVYCVYQSNELSAKCSRVEGNANAMNFKLTSFALIYRTVCAMGGSYSNIVEYRDIVNNRATLYAIP